MSHGPDTQTTVRESFDSVDAYELNLGRLNQLISDGNSWSGHERNCAFLNMQQGRFATISQVSGFDFADDGRALGLVDWDQDGDLDVWSTNRTAPQVRFLRNDNASGNQFVAMRLVGNGESTNRDAIGARVTLELAASESPDHSLSQPLIRTVRAGEGFLGQSSKWLHFGLGTGVTVSAVHVRWPGGETESFRGVQPNQFYQLVQGSGEALPSQMAHRNMQLAVSEALGKPAQRLATITLASRFPVPPLRYQDDTGAARSVADFHGAPLLITLWSPDCVPCAKELHEITQRSAELRSAGLQVLAVSTAGVGLDTGSQDAAKQWIAGIGFPFSIATASAELLDRLQWVHNVPFTLDVPLALPTSFLVDAQGQLACIYRGAVEVGPLLSDIKKLDLSGDPLLLAAGEFAGRWVASPHTASTFNMAAHLVMRQDADDAREYVKQHWQTLESSPQFSNLLSQLGLLLLNRQDFNAAEQIFRAAVQREPQSAVGQSLVGVALQAQKRSAEALVAFTQAVEIDPADVEARTLLGAALLSQGRSEEGLKHLIQAVQDGPRDKRAREQLIRALRGVGRLDDALKQERQLLGFAPAGVVRHLQVVQSCINRGFAQDAMELLKTTTIAYPDELVPWNDLAWMLATYRDQNLRDGTRAVQCAQESLRLAGPRHFGVLDTLAAAHAAAGQWDQAILHAEHAGQLALDAGNLSAAREIKARRNLYSQRKAYVEEQVSKVPEDSN